MPHLTWLDFGWVVLWLVVFVLVVALALFAINRTLFFHEKIATWLYARELAKRPQLCRAKNNGVYAVVRSCDYNRGKKITLEERAAQRFNDGFRLVPAENVLIFTDHDWQSDVRTGTEADMKELLRGCVVRKCTFYVPFSSGISNPKDERERFPYITLERACQLIHGVSWRSPRLEKLPPVSEYWEFWP